MAEISRFIQFNDETVDTKTLLLYERLVRALADANYIELKERKLIEFQPESGILSMSVFWRHRSEEKMHAGRLSDIYLLAAGFWNHFNIRVWRRFSSRYQKHPLKRFSLELMMLIEEFRLIDQIKIERPGTVDAFEVRRATYTAFHRTNVQSSMQKAFSRCFIKRTVHYFI